MPSYRSAYVYDVAYYIDITVRSLWTHIHVRTSAIIFSAHEDCFSTMDWSLSVIAITSPIISISYSSDNEYDPWCQVGCILHSYQIKSVFISGYIAHRQRSTEDRQMWDIHTLMNNRPIQVWIRVGLSPHYFSYPWLKVNERIEYKILSLTHTLLNLHISITWSLFSVLVALVRHLSPSLVHPHLPLSKSQIALSDMHHPVFGIIFLPHSVNVVHHLSDCHHHHTIHHFFSLPFQI